MGIGGCYTESIALISLVCSNCGYGGSFTFFCCFFFLQLRRTRITIPETMSDDHNIDTLDIGKYAQAGFVVVDNDGTKVDGTRTLNVTYVAGDNTATVHVESGIFLNINFQGSAVLSFHVTLYPVCSSVLACLCIYLLPTVILWFLKCVSCRIKCFFTYKQRFR